ncbi:hypothetical protein MCETOYE15_00466 [Candidatus Nanopelagicaceae bacterium]
MNQAAIFCPFCGTHLASSVAFCQSCGKQISQTASTSAAPAAIRAPKLSGYWEWFKARSLKGKVFYIWWAIVNLTGFVQLLALFAPDDTLQTGCGAKFTMRTFLDGTYEACGPTQSEQVSGSFVSLIMQNVIMLSLLIAYKKYRPMPIKPILSTSCALAVGLAVALFKNAYVSAKSEYTQDVGFSILFGAIVLAIGLIPLLLGRMRKNSL